MPVATANTEPETFQLKSAPPDGFVKLKPLPFGQILTRRDNASKLSMRTSNKRGRRGSREMDEMNIDTMQLETRFYEFSNCIVDHNLTDKAGTKLDFNKKETLSVLDPRVGSEIEDLIDKLNQEDDAEEVDEVKDSPSPSSSSARDQLKQS